MHLQIGRSGNELMVSFLLHSLVPRPLPQGEKRSGTHWAHFGAHRMQLIMWLSHAAIVAYSAVSHDNHNYVSHVDWHISIQKEASECVPDLSLLEGGVWGRDYMLQDLQMFLILGVQSTPRYMEWFWGVGELLWISYDTNRLQTCFWLPLIFRMSIRSDSATLYTLIPKKAMKY